MHTLVIPRLVFRSLLARLRRALDHTAWGRVGVCSHSMQTTWLMRDVIEAPHDLPDAAVWHDPVWHFQLLTHPPMTSKGAQLRRLPGTVGTLGVGDGPLRGTLWGAVQVGRHHLPLDVLQLVGPGMFRLVLARPPAAFQETPSTFNVPDAAVSPTAPALWSRTIGALGGVAVWQRVVGLRIAVIGVGRTGSLVATTLARLGCRHLSLIDPDRLEPHNLGEMDSVYRADVDCYKVAAVVEMLHTYASGAYATFPVPVTADSARTACTQADVLICCVDNNAARLATAMLATCYHKVLLDVGTGIALHAPGAPAPPHDDRTMGADVRLVLPGDGRLLCWGSLTNVDQAVDDLLHPRPLEAQPAWRTQRAGSLRTLNQLAAAVGVQMLQDLVIERIQTSLWAHVMVDPHGRVQVQYPSPRPAGATPCRLCARAGLGDGRMG
jgi:predicted dinucleotide-binding enzyme